MLYCFLLFFCRRRSLYSIIMIRRPKDITKIIHYSFFTIHYFSSGGFVYADYRD